MHDKSFSAVLMTEAMKGSPAVAAAAVAATWSMSDVLVAISIAYVLLQSVYLGWKWRRESARAQSDQDADDTFAELVQRLADKHQADKER